MARLFTRRKFLWALASGATLGAGGFGYARWFEAERLESTHTKIPLPPALRDGRPPLRVLHLSDFHADPRWVSLDFIRRSIAQGLALKPDVVCLTGDFVTTSYPHISEYIEALRPLVRAAPTLACLGNHDGGEWVVREGGFSSTASVADMLRIAGIEVLLNGARELSIRGVRWQFVGVEDWWAGQCKPDAAFARVPPRNGAARVLLNHNPDAKSVLQKHDWDVMLSGHTHGGQVGFAPLARRLAPVADKRFIAGLYTWENRPLFITRGIGNLHGGRIFCRPEVSLLEIG